MAEKEFLLRNKARDLMAYTYRATKPLAAEDTNRLGFSKSAYRLYGADMRECARDIVRGVYGANNCDFEHEYDKRLANIDAALCSCGLLMEFIQLCVDARLVSVKHAGEWTSKATEVRRMAAAWKKADGARAKRLREADRAKEQAELAQALARAILCAQAQQKQTQQK